MPPKARKARRVEAPQDGEVWDVHSLHELYGIIFDRAILEDFLLKTGLVRKPPSCEGCDGATLPLVFRGDKTEYYWRCASCHRWASLRSVACPLNVFPQVGHTQLLEIIYLISMDCTRQQIVSMTSVAQQTVTKIQGFLHSVMAASNKDLRRRLGGFVEVDETMWGSAQKGLHSKPSQCKGAFWAAWERGTGEFIIEEMKWMPGFHKMKGAAPADAVLPLVERWVEEGSTIFTDGLRAYLRLPKLKGKDYKHHYVRHDRGEWVAEDSVQGQKVHTQGVDGMWGHLKTWLRTRRGVRKGWLKGYVASFEWRNRTKGKNRFTALMEGVVKHFDKVTEQEEGGDEDSEGDVDLDFSGLKM